MLVQGRRVGLRMWLIPVWFVLLFVADFRFEHRSVLASAEGIASPRVIVEFATFCVAGLLALTYLVRTHWRGSRSAGLDLFLGYGLLAMASAIWSEIPLFSLVRGFEVLVLGLVAKASASIWSEGSRSLERDWRFLWALFVAFVSLLGISGFVAPNYQDERFAWQGMHPVAVGGLLGASVVAATVFLMHSSERSRGTRRLFFAAWVWCFGLMLLTVTRSALAATGASLLALISIYVHRGGSQRRAFLLLLSASALGFLWWFAPSITAYVLRGQTAEQFATLTGRVQLWGYATDLFSKSPITGYGFGSGRVLLTEAFPWGGTGHNLWVEIGLGLGILGVVVITALLTWILRRGWIMVRVRNTAVAAGAFSLCLLIAVKSIGAETFSVPGSEMTMIAMIIAAITAEQYLLSASTASSGNRQFHGVG